VLRVYLKFGHRPHTQGYLLQNVVSFVASVAQLVHGEKLRTHPLNQPADLMRREPKRLLFGAETDRGTHLTVKQT